MHDDLKRFKTIEGERYGGYYGVSDEGEVISFKRASPLKMRITENINSHDPGKPGYLSVNLRTEMPKKETVKEYVSRLVYETFGELPEDYNRADYIVTHGEGGIHDNSIGNLTLVKKGQFATDRFEGGLKNKTTDKEDLPEDAVIFREGIYDLDEIAENSGWVLKSGPSKGQRKKNLKSKLWMWYNGKYHNVTIIYAPGTLSSIRGSLIIRIKEADLPETYRKYLGTRKNAGERKDTKWFSLPVSVIMMEEYFNMPRPSDRHRTGYLDFNFLNLTRENLIWETNTERTERMYREMPMLEFNIRNTGKRNHTRNPNRISDPKEIDRMERLHFVEGKGIREVQRELGKPDSFYASIRYHLEKVKAGARNPISPDVKQKLKAD